MKRKFSTTILVVMGMIFIVVLGCKKEKRMLQQLASDSNDTTKTTGRAVVPSGNFDLIQDYVCYGWAYDADYPSQPIWIHFYIDYKADNQSAFVGAVLANSPRPDVNGIGIPGNHGFVFPIPQQFRDRGYHEVFAYAINEPQPGINPLIPASPKTYGTRISPSKPALIFPG